MSDLYMLPVKWVCNTNCVFCNFYETKWKIDEEKHFEDLKSEIDSLDIKLVKEVNVGVNWYEPTVFKYFFETLEYIKRYWFKINLFTNGVKLSDEKFVIKLSDFVSNVMITLYSSNDEEHHILTQNQDSYEVKLNAISNCLKHWIIPIQTLSAVAVAQAQLARKFRALQSVPVQKPVREALAVHLCWPTRD